MKRVEKKERKIGKKSRFGKRERERRAGKQNGERKRLKEDQPL